MKFNLSKIFIALLTMIALCLAAPANAQVSILLSGGTTQIPGVTTNQIIVGGVTNQLGSPNTDGITSSNLTGNVAQSDSIGFTWQFYAPATATNGAVAVKVYKSFDAGVTYEVNPSYTFAYTPAAPGGVWWTTNGSLTVTGGTTIGFTVENGAATAITNCLLEVNGKFLKVGSYPTTQPRPQ